MPILNAFRQPNSLTSALTSSLTETTHSQQPALPPPPNFPLTENVQPVEMTVSHTSNSEFSADATAPFGLYTTAFLANAERLEKLSSATSPFLAATRVRTAGQRLAEAQNLPPLQQIFGCCWETPGIAILFGDTGIGKSILATHIAHLITSGNTELLGLFCEFTAKVLYYDFELSDRQFDKRFAGLPFTELLLLGDTNPAAEDVEAFTFDHIVADLDRTGARFIILDNITALALTSSTADADVSIGIMKGLKRLQIEMGVASLVLAHTPKILPGQPLSLNHLAGSKHLSNFADSVFCIARSAQATQRRYIKQLKNRTAEEMPGVIVCDISDEMGYVSFKLIGVEEEHDHLAASPTEKPATSRPSKAPKEEVLKQLPALLQTPQSSGELTQSLAEHFDVSPRAIQDQLAALMGTDVLNIKGEQCRLTKQPSGQKMLYSLQEVAQAA